MLKAIDNYIFYFINKNCSNHFLDIAMSLLTQLGEWYVLLIVVLGLFFFRKKEERTTAVILSAGLVVSFLAALLLKMWVQRPRPAMLLPNINLLAKASGYSFPSGHSVNIFMFAALLSACYGKKGFWFYLAASAVGFSRIYLGVHFPSDVLAGALIGVILGKILQKLVKVA
ncbi:MAG: phosphatase PAP2 family protein [Candidatus Omnitrophica bacterium]|nr:phosphatase PAP2 family protein [Candidatus Omnitrophota bacterium]